MIAKKPKFLKRVTVLPLFKIKGVSWLLYGGGAPILECRNLKYLIVVLIAMVFEKELGFCDFCEVGKKVKSRSKR